MAELPPPFFSEPACGMHLAEDDPSFTGPDRLAREAAAATLLRDDRAMADALSRARRSGAPDRLLSTMLANYASAHELESNETRAIAVTTRFVSVSPVRGRVTRLAVLGEIATRIVEPIGRALATAQADDDPCRCPKCIAQTASLN
jgi:hypothetical protein